MLIEHQPATPLDNGARGKDEIQEPRQAVVTSAEAVAPSPSTAPAVPPAHQEPAVDDEHLTMADLLDNPAHAIPTLQRGEVVEGIVARIDPDEVLVDVGLKSEGVIAGREMDDELSGTLRVGS